MSESDAIADVKWIKEHGLRGGVLLPNVAPDVSWVKPLYHPDYDRLWASVVIVTLASLLLYSCVGVVERLVQRRTGIGLAA